MDIWPLTRLILMVCYIETKSYSNSQSKNIVQFNYGLNFIMLPDMNFAEFYFVAYAKFEFLLIYGDTLFHLTILWV